MMHQRNAWQHYRIHRQAIGGPNQNRGSGLVWTYQWQVKRPENHTAMQGDGYDTEGRGYQRFDTHAQAVVWTNRELFKDALLAEIDRLRDLIEDA